MNPKVNYLVVGLFVVTIFTATIIFALWLAFGYGEVAQNTYLIYMNESVSGLSKDADVKFNGVTVGTVENIDLAKDPSQVVVTVQVEKKTPVNIDTRATLMSQGLTGLSYINLSGGERNSPPLLPKAGEKYAVIPSNPSLLVRLDTVIGKLNASLGQISESVNSLLSPENQKNMHKILGGISTMLNSANQSFATVNTQTLPSANASLLELNGALPNFSNFMHELSQNPTMLLKGPSTDQLGPGEQP